MKPIRCAIYTRKSSDEGLDQNFNSLDAQREACAAYIKSQASEGWTALPDLYDDGGISGGTLERPALKRLMVDVADRRIDVIVVYKVDRLSRSLFDFAKLVEQLEKAGTSFVSITQPISTTTSMGRLTLNMLLSFAQFEREVTAERIRDKIAASKAKGMWMGGVPPLGYAPNGRSLQIIDNQAELVRDIYRRYLALGNVRLLEEALRRERIMVPKRSTNSGRALGGGLFTRGQLYFLLGNRIYVGDIPHGKISYPGNHPAIIERAQFDEVQAMLAAHVQGSRTRTRSAQPSLLAGKLIDEAGQPLISQHACKGTVRHRYYVSRDLHHGHAKRGLRLPAASVEYPVAERIAEALADPIGLLAIARLETADLDLLMDRCCYLTALARGDRTRQLLGVVERVQLAPDGLRICCDRRLLAELLEAELTQAPEEPMMLTIAATFQRKRSLRLVTSNGVPIEPAKDTALPKLIAQGRAWWKEMREDQMNVSAIAAREKMSKSYVSRVVRLAFLSPAVVDAALAGQLKADVDTAALKLEGGFSSNWQEQAKALLPVG